jgi:hypothetical protein
MSTVLLSVSGRNAKPHTTLEQHVVQMRDLTCCSYISLIVDTRNITGRHRSGNAWATPAPIPPVDSGILLEGIGDVQTCGRRPVVVQGRDNPAAFALHIGARRRRRTITWCFQRLKRNHRSTVVRRNVVPQPLVVLGGFLRRNAVALVNR